MHLFGSTFPDHLAVPRRNFQHIGRAWLMAFQTLTGDDWCNQMYQYMNVAGPVLPCLVYGMCFVSCNYILTNLFIAVILENFEMAEGVKKVKQEIVVLKNNKKLISKTIERLEAAKEAAADDGGMAVGLLKTKSNDADADEDSFDHEDPMLNLKTGQVKVNGCANSCRKPILWCCRGCRKEDWTKKTRNQQAEMEANPEVRSHFCCHGKNKLCGISEDNNASLFLFHGRTETYVTIDEDVFGDTIEHHQWYGDSALYT